MAADKAHSITPLHQIPLNHMKNNKDMWCVSDISLQSLDKIVVSGCKQKSRKTFIDVFSVAGPSSKPTPFYSKELSTKYTSELWRVVSLLDDSHVITCFDDCVEKISIKKDKVVQSWKLPQGGASCIFVKEREVFIGFSGSCDVIVLNSNLRQIRMVTLDALQDDWPVDLVVVSDTLLICSVGCVQRRALAVRGEDGHLLREYINPRSDDSVPLSLTVIAEADLVAILWNSPPQLTIHSFSHGNCLVVADVEPAERVRGVGQDKLVMVNEKGEMKVFLLEQILTFDNLKAVLALFLVRSDCRDIMDFFGMPCDQNNPTECSDSDKPDKDQGLQNQRFLTSLETSGYISSENVTSLLEALQELNKSDSLISPVKAYKKYSGFHRGRKRSRKKSPWGRKDDHVKRKKITEGTSPKNDTMDGCSTGEEQDSSDTKQDSTADADEQIVMPSSEQDTFKSPTTELNQCNHSPQPSELDAPSEKDTQELESSVEEDSEEVVMETEQEEEENVTVEQRESDQRSNNGPTLKERMVTMLGEIQGIKQQNELILSLLRTFTYPQQYSCGHQCSQHPPTVQSMQTLSHQLSHVNTPIHSQSQPVQQVQAPTHQQIGLMQMAQPSQLTPSQPLPSHPTQSQPLPVVQPSQAPPPSQPINPLQPTQPVTLLPQMQLSSHPGAQIPPCTCKVPPPPPATNVLAQPPPVSVQPGSTMLSNHQPSNAPLPSTQSSKSVSHTSTSCTPTRAPLPPPIQHTFNSPPPFYPPALVPMQPNPNVTFQPSVPVYAYHYPNVPSYISGPVPTSAQIQLTPYPAPQLAPPLPQGPGQPATNLPSQVSSQAVTIPTVSQQTPIVPSISVTSQSTNAQPPSQHGATTALPTTSIATNIPSSNVVFTPYQQRVLDQSSLLALLQSLPLNVQEEISSHKGSDDPKARDRVARSLIRHFFTSEVRVKSNCAGVFGYARLDPEKLYTTRCLVFYLCPIRSGVAGAEATEWKRLIKIIDSYNRSHRKYTNTKMALKNGGSDQASMNKKS